jgi:AcrR family transcriptional regulator
VTAAPERESDELRARLIRAAAAVFAREGYAGTKIMDIVREAGVSTGTVYGRFRSKNELLRDDEVADALADAYERWRAGVEPLVAAAEAEGSLSDIDPEAVLFLFRILHLGMLLHRGSGLDGPDPAAWRALVERMVAALGRPESG